MTGMSPYSNSDEHDQDDQGHDHHGNPHGGVPSSSSVTEQKETPRRGYLNQRYGESAQLAGKGVVEGRLKKSMSARDPKICLLRAFCFCGCSSFSAGFSPLPKTSL